VGRKAVPSINIIPLGLEVWFKWESACLSSMRPHIQIPVLPKKISLESTRIDVFTLTSRLSEQTLKDYILTRNDPRIKQNYAAPKPRIKAKQYFETSLDRASLRNPFVRCKVNLILNSSLQSSDWANFCREPSAKKLWNTVQMFHLSLCRNNLYPRLFSDFSMLQSALSLWWMAPEEKYTGQESESGMNNSVYKWMLRDHSRVVLTIY
jgi:hypothetical protein